MDRNEALERLRAARPTLERFGVARAGLFGSTARGEARPDSDIDVIVEFRPGDAPGLAFFQLEDELGALFGHHVQMSSLDSMNAVVRAQVEMDLVYV
jgi:predicted nucleotidyltransferase